MNYGKEELECINKLNSRSAVGYALEKLYNENDSVVAVYADVGSRFSVKGRLGCNDIEIGISEQTLVPMLGGMAHEGGIPFGIAYAPFITMRAADQIRMTVGEMGLNIKLVGGSAGLVSGNLGAASLALEDVSMMRAIPNLVIMSPSDCISEVKLIEIASAINKPVYIRLTGGKLEPIYSSAEDVTFGKNREVLKYGNDAVLFSTGVATSRTLEAGRILKEKGINVTIVDILFIKPIDEKLLSSYSMIKNVFTVEEHSIIGGIGSSISEYVAEHTNQSVTRIGVSDTYMYPDTYEKLLSRAGLDAIGIAKTVENTLNKSQS